MNKIPHITVGRCCVAAVFPSLPACGELIKVGTPRRGVRAVTYILQIFLNLLPTLLTLLPANATPTTKLTDADLAQVRFDQKSAKSERTPLTARHLYLRAGEMGFCLIVRSVEMHLRVAR
jgi:hypothetical protein